jgi:ATP-dependent Clp protease adaptor protein ClpS
MPFQQPSIDIDLVERLRMLPRYRVLLHNDDFHDMEHVVRALLVTVATLSANDAITIMLKAHTQGVAEVVTCPRETAEFYIENLRTFGLMCSMEPV